jgi:hypothetical protein
MQYPLERIERICMVWKERTDSTATSQLTGIGGRQESNQIFGHVVKSFISIDLDIAQGFSHVIS